LRVVKEPEISKPPAPPGRDGARRETTRGYQPGSILALSAGVGIAAAAAKWLEVLGDRPGPPPAAPALLAFGACLLLAFVAGRRAPQTPEAEGVREVAAPDPVSGARALGTIGLGLASAILFAMTWVLQGRTPVPLAAIASWTASIAALGAAFAAATRARSGRRRARRHPVALAALTIVLLLGSWSRLAGLGEVPASFGGDEANQTRDGRGLLTGTTPGDPFGTGWYGTIRLGMLPAGIGALACPDPFSGPRRPYAVAGTLSLFVATAAGGLLAGTWGALATAALLAFAPHHVHFSRLASVMILDALAAAVFLVLLFRTRETGSPVSGFFAGASAGLALYGYSAGRVVPALLLVAGPLLVASRIARGRRTILAAALASGFLLAAAPNLRFAASHFDDWNSRFNQVGIFRQEWWGPEVAKLGSPARVLSRQIVAGTVGLLSRHTPITWFTGYPMVAPYLLPALATAGLGWLLGQRRYFAALVLGLLVAGNLAAVILTDTAPAPQRLSSLSPALAILGGAALAGFVSLFPRRGGRGAPARTAAGAFALAGVLLACLKGLPPWWDPSPGYGGASAAFALAASKVLQAPRYAGESIVLDGLPYLDSTFPSVGYLLPSTRFVNRDPVQSRTERPPAGLHLVVPEWMSLVPDWKTRFGIGRAVALPDPRDPVANVGYLLRMP
jgi:hypothetical protein